MTQQFHCQIFTQENESGCPHKALDPSVHSSFTHNSPELETTQMPTSGWPYEPWFSHMIE